MLCLVGLIFALFCVDGDYALPVPNIMNSGDRWNFLLLAGISVIGMGAILACVRCRRKKRGFEEFKNEANKATRTATTVEAIRTEFPIFQALSTPSSPQFQQLDNDSSRDSRDDLHDLHAKVVASCDERPNVRRREEQYFHKAPDVQSEETIVLTFDTLEIEGKEEPQENTFSYQPHVPDMERESEEETTGDATRVASQPKDAEYEASVELALRELDIAIGDSEEDDNDDENDEQDRRSEMGVQRNGSVSGDDEGDEEQHLENVIRQLFMDNMLSSLSSLESEAVQGQPLENDAMPDVEESIGGIDENEQQELPEVAKDVTITILEKLCEVDRPVQEAVSEDNFFDDLPAICQSTPSVRGKREAVLQIGGERPKPATLFNEDEEDALTKGVVNEEAEETFVVSNRPGACIPDVQVCQEAENLVDATFEVVAVEGKKRGAPEADKSNYLRDNNATITPVNTPIEVTFECAAEREGGAAGEGDMTFTKDLDCYDDQSPTNHMGGGNGGGWFLHPQECQPAAAASDETFNFDDLPPPPPPIDGYYGEEEEEDDGENWGYGSRANTDFDALRKQLVDLLPHAQGAPALEDEGAVGGSCESGMSASVLEAMLNNIDPGPSLAAAADQANYKRPLSPIMEESEEENTTIKTSVLLDTKNMDSTSTGVIETLSEAVMGVTRTLMASNDTLFNFEDTLGDRDELTPTPTAAGGAYSAVVNTMESPTHQGALNETFPMASKSNSTFVMDEEQEHHQPNGERQKLKPTMSLDLTAVRADIYTSALDVLSPEQQKTFSEDITSVDHVSGSDASGNLDADGTYTTNTIEMETCISLNRDEEESADAVDELEKDEHDVESSGESAVTSSSKNDVGNSTATTGLLVDDAEEEKEKDYEAMEGPGENSLVSEDCSLELPAEDPLEQTKRFLAREIDYSRWNKVSSSRVNAAVFHVQAVKRVPALEMELEKCWNLGKQGTEMTGVDTSNNNVTFDWNENCANGGDLEESKKNLSGEEDPWGTESKIGGKEIDGNEEEEMVTVFNSEWDIESAEDSENNAESDEKQDQDGQSMGSSDDSSEEFMYVGGNNLPTNQADEAWGSHVDQIPIANKEDRKFETLAEEDEDGNHQEVETEEGAASDGEFLPSLWNSNAKPRRSAMKSPDKSSSDEDSNDATKKRPRSVAFKKQQYHSVYEYPREMNPLSPSLSEPTFSVNFREQISPNSHAMIGDIDGFMITSSTRPFQTNQCNTWPTESDFSWSHHMPEEETKSTEGTVVYSEIPIEWPRKVLILDTPDADDSGSESNNQLRSDSGVGESEEFLNDPVPLGELCHTKGSLRLPLANAPLSTAVTVFGSAASTKDGNEEQGKESCDDNMGLPTPSCTGSMDSLSSSSCSDRQLASFTTFRQLTPQSSVDATEKKLTVAAHDSGHGGDEEEEEYTSVVRVDGQQRKEVVEIKLAQKRISDSTDEDSGIENISRRVN